jgi:thiol-disulfide isomerase/thioredoxin
MKKLLSALCLVGSLYQPAWHYNLSEAREIAGKEHKHILLNFSGSDWCGPCILLRKDVLDNAAFLQTAGSLLVLVNADFPRMKKNQLSKEQQALNDQMADRYNAKGEFPLTLLLNADGKVLRQWVGNPGLTAMAFSEQVRSAIGADR